VTAPADERTQKPDPDAGLMARVREGDREAFRELYEKHGAAVSRYVVHFTANPARAEEITQDVFLQVYRARERWEPRARFTTWLYTIAHNLCLNELRRFEYRGRIRALEGSEDDEGPPAIDPPDERALEGAAVVSGREIEGRLRELLEGLPEKQRTALLLSRFEGLRYEEVGEVLGCSEQAVKSLIFRATQRLKEGLKGWIEDE